MAPVTWLGNKLLKEQLNNILWEEATNWETKLKEALQNKGHNKDWAGINPNLDKKTRLFN